MNWLNLGKFALRGFTSMSVGRVVRNVIEHTTPAEVSKVGQVSLAFGGYVLSSMIGAAAGDYVIREVERVLPEAKVEADETLEA